MARRWNESIREDGVTKEQRESHTKVSVELFENAPAIVIACLTMEDMNKYLDDRRRKFEYAMAVQSVAAAVQNMLLAAHGEGLGSCWFCAPLFCQDVVRKTLKMPRQVDPQALITLGYPANRRGAPPRKPLEEIVHQNHWRHVT